MVIREWGDNILAQKRTLINLESIREKEPVG